MRGGQKSFSLGSTFFLPYENKEHKILNFFFIDSLFIFVFFVRGDLYVPGARGGEHADVFASEAAKRYASITEVRRGREEPPPFQEVASVKSVFIKK